VEQLRSGAPEIDARLDALGRAAITARATVEVLRESFAITMPTLADRLEVSRPAAADALERLVALGVASEVTGRRRDRVYAYEAALSVAESAAAS
jgi:ribosomal protein S25